MESERSKRIKEDLREKINPSPASLRGGVSHRSRIDRVASCEGMKAGSERFRAPGIDESGTGLSCPLLIRSFLGRPLPP
jgi:hypothetical protein